MSILGFVFRAYGVIECSPWVIIIIIIIEWGGMGYIVRVRVRVTVRVRGASESVE